MSNCQVFGRGPLNLISLLDLPPSISHCSTRAARPTHNWIFIDIKIFQFSILLIGWLIQRCSYQSPPPWQVMSRLVPSLCSYLLLSSHPFSRLGMSNWLSISSLSFIITLHLCVLDWPNVGHFFPYALLMCQSPLVALLLLSIMLVSFFFLLRTKCPYLLPHTLYEPMTLHLIQVLAALRAKMCVTPHILL